MSEFGQSDRQRMSIVALGSFNPAIFHPVWFARHQLIRDKEADSSQVKVMSPEITVVESEWFALQVTTERFSLETRDPRKFLPLKDLVTATFEILEHTPVRAFGFNSVQACQLASTDAWHHFGHHFAPKVSWDGILDGPGLRILTIQGTRSGSSADRIQISIQPAVNSGIVISINEHYDVKQSDDQAPPSPSSLISGLEQGWNSFLDYSRVVGEHLLKEGELPK
jgi:hypothetical protein